MSVALCSQPSGKGLAALLSPYNMEVIWVSPTEVIPGSYWGDDEAGLIANRLYLRPATPIHSALHEACHYICMPSEQRNTLDTDAGGDYDEENAVCYLQILLAGCLENFSQIEMMQDMDSWGYTFRLGSARAWFEQDAEDAKQWLLTRGIINNDLSPSGQLRI